MNIQLQAILFATIGTLFTFIMTTLGAATVFFFANEIHAKYQKAIIGFAAGVMTAASVWSLLLPAIDQTERDGLWPGYLPASVGILAGVLFLGVLDTVLPKLRVRKADTSTMNKQNALLMSAITLHNIPEGMAVGLAFALAADGDGWISAVALALGIGIQNFPEGAAISLPLRQEGKGRWCAFLGGTLSGIVEPIFGVLVVFVAADASPLMPWLLSFAAGAMLYVVVDELIPQSSGHAGTCGFVLGFLIMMVLDVALG